MNNGRLVAPGDLGGENDAGKNKKDFPAVQMRGDARLCSNSLVVHIYAARAFLEIHDTFCCPETSSLAANCNVFMTH